MLENPETKYRPFQPIPLQNRQWPARTITKPPIWLSTDLRDGNQALREPMGIDAKLRMFDMLTEIGFKEIEVSFPSASQPDFDFVRRLIEEDRIPDDVTIQVLTQARAPLIRRTMESLRGAKKAIVHVYAATAPKFRDSVLGMSKQDVIDMAVDSVKLIRELAQKQPRTDFALEFSPEVFSQTELTYAQSICGAVMDAWGASPQRKVILNLPATVEASTPNAYADMIECMGRLLDKRDSAIISLHPHNDRGTAVAAAEQGLLAGADRVEGCLFGNGERTGNVDLVTMALNLYTQGISPGLDFSNMDEVIATVEELTKIPVGARHPYAGELVFTAFSGSHQDAIRKNMPGESHAQQHWDVPYLPIDPKDLGRSYEAVIRVNSQSGKAGAAYLLEQSLGGIQTPRGFQIEFSNMVQARAEATGREVTTDDIGQIFRDEYLGHPKDPIAHSRHRFSQNGDDRVQKVGLTLQIGGQEQSVTGEGNGPVDAVVNALSLPIDVRNFEERSMGQGSNAKAIAFVEIGVKDGSKLWGVGIHENTTTASVLAVLGGVNRAARQGKLDIDARFPKLSVEPTSHRPVDVQSGRPERNNIG